MRVDSTLIRSLFVNLSKCSIIIADLSSLKKNIWYDCPRYYTTENIAHSTPSKGHFDVEPSALYANPVCMQMDQLMYSCSDHEELLNLLVSHRGAMYLHNLVTVMNLLRGFVENENKGSYKPDCEDLYLGYKNIFRKKTSETKSSVDFSGFSKTEKELISKVHNEVLAQFENPRNKEYLEVYNHSRDLRDIIIRDERYDLLLQDLYVNKNKLDVVSICQVILALDALGHNYYRLYNGLLKRLLVLDISFSDQTPSFINNVGLLLLKTSECYARAGFYDNPLYSKVSNQLFRNNILRTLKDSEHHQILSHMIRLYGMVNTYDFPVFYKISESVDFLKLSPSDVSQLAVTFSNHRNFHKVHDKVLYSVADRLRVDSKSFDIKELCLCVSSFSKMRLYFKDVWRICTTRLIEEIDISTRGFDDSVLDIKELCKVLHDIATVDCSSQLVHNLVEKVSFYLEERIDSLDEESCINFAMAVLATNSSLISNSSTSNLEEEVKSIKNENLELENNLPTDFTAKGFDNSMNLNNYLLSFVFRRIGTEVFWEKEPLKVFSIWLYHMLVFPHFNHNIHKRCILPCFREWLLAYHTNYELQDEIFKISQKLSSKFKIYSKNDKPDQFKTLLESPVPINFLVLDEKLANKVINVIESTVRNHPNMPTGVDLVMKGILEYFGLEVHVIDYNHWNNLDIDEKTKLVESIILGSPL